MKKCDVSPNAEGVIWWPVSAPSKDRFDLQTIEEVEAMRSSTNKGGFLQDDWLRLARMPLRPLVASDVPKTSWRPDYATIYVREDGELFRMNSRTGRMMSAHGCLNGFGGVAWDVG
jgi:hypothetical protein